MENPTDLIYSNWTRSFVLYRLGPGGEVSLSDFGFGFFLAVVFFDCLDIQGGLSCIPLNPEPKVFAHNVHGLSGRFYSYTDLFNGSSFPSSTEKDGISRYLKIVKLVD